MSIHYIEQRIEQIVPYSIVEIFSIEKNEKHRKHIQKRSLQGWGTVMPTKNKNGALLRAFIDPKDLTRVTCCVWMCKTGERGIMVIWKLPSI